MCCCFRSDEDEDSPPHGKVQKLIAMSLADAEFAKHEQATFTPDMLEVAAECALFLWEELDPRLKKRIRWDRHHILDTLARCITRNHALVTLHAKHGRMVEMPQDHRVLHSPGSHLYTALKR